MNFKKIEALVPVAAARTSYKIYFSDGQELLVERRLDSLLKGMAAYEMIDLRNLRRFVRQTMNLSDLVPLPLAPGHVFIAVKVRRASKKNDPCFAYVKLAAIESYQSFALTLKSGQVLSTLASKASLEQSMLQGRVAQALMVQRQELLEGL